MRQTLRTVLLVSFVQLSLIANAHAEGPKVWFENDGGLHRDQLTNGKVKVNQGFFGGYELKDLLKDNPAALALVDRQSHFNTCAHLSYWLGVIPSAVVLGYGSASNNSTVEVISIVTLVGTAILTGHFISESRHYMYEAVNVYNGVVKSKEDVAPETSSLRLTPSLPSIVSNSNTVGFSLNF